MVSANSVTLSVGSGDPLADQWTRRFFATLLAVTLLPYVWMPLSWLAWPEMRERPWQTALLLFIGSQAHVGASFYFYSDRALRQHMLVERRWRYVYAAIAVVVMYPAAAWFAGQLPKGVLKHDIGSLMLVFYWSWQAHHYARQNYGIMAFLSRAERVSLSLSDRRALELTSYGGVIGVVAFVLIDGGHVTPLRDYLWVVSIALTALGWVLWLGSLVGGAATSRAHRLGMAVNLAFFLPIYFFDAVLPAILGFATAHGLQYFVFMGCVTSPPRFGWRPALIALVCAGAGGYLLLRLAGSPLITVGLAIVMVHFIMDAGVWKLSEPLQRSYMAKRFPFLEG